MVVKLLLEIDSTGLLTAARKLGPVDDVKVVADVVVVVVVVDLVDDDDVNDEGSSGLAAVPLATLLTGSAADDELVFDAGLLALLLPPVMASSTLGRVFFTPRLLLSPWLLLLDAVYVVVGSSSDASELSELRLRIAAALDCRLPLLLLLLADADDAAAADDVAVLPLLDDMPETESLSEEDPRRSRALAEDVLPPVALPSRSSSEPSDPSELRFRLRFDDSLLDFLAEAGRGGIWIEALDVLLLSVSDESVSWENSLRALAMLAIGWILEREPPRGSDLDCMKPSCEWCMV